MSRLRVDELINQGNSGPTLAVEGLQIPANKELAIEGSITLNGNSGLNGQVLARTTTGLGWANVPLTDNDTTYTLSSIDGTNNPVTEKVIRLAAGGSGSGHTDVTLIAGTNVSLIRSGSRITINSSFTDTNTITRVGAGGSNYTSGDINFVGGGDLTISQSGRTFTFTVADDDTIYTGESGVTVTTDNKIKIGQPVAPTDAVTFAQATITGNLIVQGTTVTSQTQTVTTTDKFINLADVLLPSDSLANGGGIVLKGDTDHTILWSNPDDSWSSSENFNLALTREFRINNVAVLDATSLGVNVVDSSLTSVGVLSTGRWNAETIAIAHGGTGETSANAALNALLPAQASNAGKYLTTDGQDTTWETIPPTYSGWSTADATGQIAVGSNDVVRLLGTGATTVNLNTSSKEYTINSENTLYTFGLENNQAPNKRNIRLTDSNAVYNEIVLSAGTGLTLTRSGSELEFSVAQELGASASPTFAGLTVSGTIISGYYEGDASSLANLTGVANGIYGSGSQIPVITVGPSGRIEDISTVIAGTVPTGIVAGGSAGSIQYNVNGSFAGTTKFRYEPSQSTLAVEGIVDTTTLDATGANIANLQVSEYLKLPSKTNSERDALNVQNGSIVYNNSTDAIEMYQDGTWVKIGPTVLNDYNVEFLANVSSNTPTVGQVLKWNGNQWAPGTDLAGTATSGGNIRLNDLFAVTQTNGSGSGRLDYDDSTGIFVYTPPDLSSYLTSYTETDPVYSASPAANISSALITQWNTAYSWGNHADAGYLTSASLNETDTLGTVVARGNTISGDIISTGKIYYSNVWSTLTSLQTVNAGTYHGMFAHAHDTGHGYLAHGGLWKQLLDTSSNIRELTDVSTNTPSDGQVLMWSDSNNLWEPQTIVQGGGGTGANVSISDTAPTSPNTGDLWWKSNEGSLKIYYQDTDSSQWIDASPGGGGGGGSSSDDLNAVASRTATTNIDSLPYRVLGDQLQVNHLQIGSAALTSSNDYRLTFGSSGKIRWLNNELRIESTITGGNIVFRQPGRWRVNTYQGDALIDALGGVKLYHQVSSSSTSQKLRTSNVGVEVLGTLDTNGALKLSTNNATVQGTTGTAGEIKQIGGAPFYYDGSTWREFALYDGIPVTTQQDTDWDNVLLRLDFEQTSTNVALVENRKDLTGGVDEQVDSVVNTNVDLTSSPVKFGSKALRFNGSGGTMPFAWTNRVSGTNDPLMDFEGAFTIELWIYVSSLPNSTSETWPIVSSTLISSTPDDDWALTLNYNQGSTYTFNWYSVNRGDDYNNAGGTGAIIGSVNNTTLLNQWNHIALVRRASDSSMHFYINGAETGHTDGSITTVTDSTVNWGGTSSYISFGYHYKMRNAVNHYFTGVMDDVRLSKSERYTSNFTPPTAAQPISGTTTTYTPPPSEKGGVITLGTTPSWRGTSGVTVSRTNSGQYRLTFTTSFADADDYFVVTQPMDQGFAAYVGVARSATHVDFTINRQSNDAAVDTGSLSVQVLKHS